MVVVLGHHDGSVAGHPITATCLRRVRLAEAVAADPDVRAVIMSGWSSDPAWPSEARQMKAAWRGPAKAVLLEERSTITAENAARCLPLVLAMPGIHRVTVVTSSWHVRARWFFRHYRVHGIEVEVRHAPSPPGEWRRHLLKEIRGLAAVPRQARAAYHEAGDTHFVRALAAGR